MPKDLIGRVRGAPIHPDLAGVNEVVKVMLDKNDRSQIIDPETSRKNGYPPGTCTEGRLHPKRS